MALSKCKECGKDISEKARACPHCGSPLPEPTSWVVKLLAGLFVLAFLSKLLDCSGSSTPPAIPPPPPKAAQLPPPPQKTAEQIAAEEAACKKDLQCWGDKNLGKTFKCEKAIEHMAKYDLRWENEWLAPKFTQIQWLNKDKGTLTYFGDKLKLQNGFGAWENIVYECDLDPATNAVLGVRAHPGHL